MFGVPLFFWMGESFPLEHLERAIANYDPLNDTAPILSSLARTKGRFVSAVRPSLFGISVIRTRHSRGAARTHTGPAVVSSCEPSLCPLLASLPLSSTPGGAENPAMDECIDCPLD